MVDVSGWPADAALEALLAAADEAVLVFDEALHCRAAGRRAGEILGVDPRALLGRRRMDVVAEIAGRSSAPDAVLSSLGDAALGEEATLADPVFITVPRPATLVWTSVPLLRGGRVVGRLDLLRDVTRERHAEEEGEAAKRKLEEVSPVDDLTGLANRRRLLQDCEREHRRAQRAWEPYAIASLAIDGLPRDGAVSDDVLLRVAEALRAPRREYDVVARWEGGVFAILLPRASASAARSVMKRVVRGFAAAKGEGGVAPVTLSAGVAVWAPPSAETADDILQRASAALDQARAKGPASLVVDAGPGGWKDEIDDELSEA